MLRRWGIHNEYLKMGSDLLIPTITTLFNQILETEEIATEWKQSTIILLHKKEPKDDINNYRPNNLLSNLYKLFMQIITKTMSKKLDENQPVEQAGFRSQFCTIDHLQATREPNSRTGRL